MSEYKEIPLLTARDVELRVSQLFDDSVVMLVYKDARVDMRVLDECFGWQNWQRKHEVIDGNLYCSVLIKNQETGEWIEKQDVGKPSKTEAEKGNASDSFKRACFNVGIGRELYDAPYIKIYLSPDELGTNNKGQKYLKAKFRVGYMAYNKALGQFDEFTVVDGKNNVRFEYKDGRNNSPKKSSAPYNPPNPPYNASNQQANTNIPNQQQNAVNPQNNANTANVQQAHKCCQCGADINEKVYNYSLSKYKMPLCFKHQKEADRANGK